MTNLFGSNKSTTNSTSNNAGTYSGDTTSTYTPSAYGTYSNLLNTITGQGTGLTNYQNQAVSGIAGLQGAYQPTMTTAQNLVTSGSQAVSPSQISNYMNPYTSSVTNASLAQMANQYDISQNKLVGNATIAGALGGNRLGVAQGVNAGEYGRNVASTVSGLNAANYNQAVSNAQTDQSRAISGGSTLGNLASTSQNLGLTGYNELYSAGLAPYQNLQLASNLTTGVGGQMGGTTAGTSGGTYSGTTNTAGTTKTSNSLGSLGSFLTGVGSIASAVAANGGAIESKADGGLVTGFAGGGTVDPYNLDSLGRSAREGLHKFLFADGGETTATDVLAADATAAPQSYWERRYNPQPVTVQPATVEPSALERIWNKVTTPTAEASAAPAQPQLPAGQEGMAFAEPSQGLGAMGGASQAAPIGGAAPAASGASAAPAATSSPLPGVAGAAPSTMPTVPAAQTAPAGVVGVAPSTAPAGLGAFQTTAEPTDVSDHGLQFIRDQEDFSSTPYEDYKQTSIGYGTKARPGETSITREEGEKRLRGDTAEVASWIHKNVTAPLTQGRFDALVSFGMNTGTGSLDKLKKDINAGDWQTVRDRMQTFNHAGGKEKDALTKRRALEGEMIMGGGAPSSATARPGQPGFLEGLFGGRSAQPTGISGLGATSQPGFLRRLLGNDVANVLNPLGLTRQEGLDLMRMGLSSAGGHPERMADVLQQSQAAEMQGRKMALEAMQMQAGLAEPKVMGEQINPQTGMMQKQYGAFNPQTGSYQPIAAPAGLSSGAPQQALAGPAALAQAQQQQPEIAAQAADVIAGREALPTPSRSNPQALAVQHLVRQIDPGYNANRFKYMQQWSDPKGTAGPGFTRVAVNSGIGHAGELAGMVDNLPDHMFTAANRIQNWWSEARGDPDIAAWKAVVTPLAGEIAKITTGKAPTQHEITVLADQLDPSHGKRAIDATLAKWTHLLGSKVDALGADYVKNVGPYADKPEVIDEGNKAILADLQSRYQGGKHAEKPTAGQFTKQRPIGFSDVQLRKLADDKIRGGTPRDLVAQQMHEWGINY